MRKILLAKPYSELVIMHYLILSIILVIAIFGPQWWAKYILKKHQQDRTDIRCNGAQLAEFLIRQLQLTDVNLEETDMGDHYDPINKAVRLSKDNMNNHSLTAIATAAHEVGHAIQDASGYQPLFWRGRLVRLSAFGEKIGSICLFISPLLAVYSPRLMLALFMVTIGSMLLTTIVHLITLPVEWNASFKRALPILQDFQLIPQEDHQHARQILKACALTYLASSLASLLNLWRWIRVLRR